HHHHTLAAGRIENFVAMTGEQRLVGGNHVLALADRLHDPLLGDRLAADELDDNIDIGVASHLEPVGGDAHVAVAQQSPGLFNVAHGHRRHLDTPPGTPCDLFSVLLQHLPGAATHDSQTQKPDLD